MKRQGKRYNHFYNGDSNSRGKRSLSKLHKGFKLEMAKFRGEE